MRWRKIFVISIIVICIVSINLAVYMQITQKEKKSIKKSDIEPVVVDTVELTENFEHIFDNKIDYQNNDISSTTKIDTSKELIYTIQTKQEKQDGKYDINVNIPYINISNSNIENINKEKLKVVEEAAKIFEETLQIKLTKIIIIFIIYS